MKIPNASRRTRLNYQETKSAVPPTLALGREKSATSEMEQALKLHNGDVQRVRKIQVDVEVARVICCLDCAGLVSDRDL